MMTTSLDPAAPWRQLRYLTASVLPVRRACDMQCRFCFSASSISDLPHEARDLRHLDLEGWFAEAQAMGATRLVITGGGEPLLRPAATLDILRRAAPFFQERACFTHGGHLTPQLAAQLQDAGLSYLCWSRHATSDADNRRLMGPRAPALADVLEAARGLKVRATCVMTRGAVDSAEAAWAYVDAMRPWGVAEFTFKHTYVAYARSVFQGSPEDTWAREHQINADPFEPEGGVIGALPWGPKLRHLRGVQLCWYHEPTPTWELEHRIGRSLNLLSSGEVYGSLEDHQSLLSRLPSSPAP